MKDLDNIFKDKLANHQAPVDPSAWNAIQSGIDASSSAGASGSAAFSIKALVGGLLAVSLVSTAVYFAVTEPSTKEALPEQQQQEVLTIDEEKPSEEVNSDFLVENQEGERFEEERIQRSILTSEIQLVEEEPTQYIAKVEEQKATTVYEKQNSNVSEKNESENTADDLNVSPGINRGHNENRRSEIPPNTQELSASFYGIQDEYDALRFELIPEMLDAHAYFWEVDGQYFSEQELDYTFEQSGVYPVVLTVTGRTGAIEKHTLELQVFEPPVFKAPNSFSPNNDNKNPTLDFEALSKGITIIETNVYSLSGELIFKGDEYSQKWDGTYNSGDPCPEGQYLWTVIYKSENGKEFNEQGFVSIFR